MQETEHFLLPALLWNRPSGHLYPVLAAKGRGYFLEGRHCYLACRIWGNSTRQKLDYTHLCTLLSISVCLQPGGRKGCNAAEQQSISFSILGSHRATKLGKN